MCCASLFYDFIANDFEIISNITTTEMEKLCSPVLTLFVPQRLGIRHGQDFNTTLAACKQENGTVISSPFDSTCLDMFLSKLAEFLNEQHIFSVWTNECQGVSETSRCKTSDGKWLERRIGLRPVCAKYSKFGQDCVPIWMYAQQPTVLDY